MARYKIGGRGRRPKHEMVRIIELDEIFPSYHEAADRIDGNRGCVYLCLQGMRTSHKGYTFEYVKDLYPIFD